MGASSPCTAKNCQIYAYFDTCHLLYDGERAVRLPEPASVQLQLLRELRTQSAQNGTDALNDVISVHRSPVAPRYCFSMMHPASCCVHVTHA
jgi:hypothetical protein